MTTRTKHRDSTVVVAAAVVVVVVIVIVVAFKRRAFYERLLVWLLFGKLNTRDMLQWQSW